jgi:hypothetical protein
LATGSFTDPKNARTIYLAAGGLVLLALLLAAGTVLWWRSSKAEHPSLGPLEAMGSRRFTRSDGARQQVLLDRSRPVKDTGEPVQEPVDLKAAASAPLSLDDLLAQDDDDNTMLGSPVPDDPAIAELEMETPPVDSPVIRLAPAEPVSAPAAPLEGSSTAGD